MLTTGGLFILRSRFYCACIGRQRGLLSWPPLISVSAAASQGDNRRQVGIPEHGITGIWARVCRRKLTTWRCSDSYRVAVISHATFPSRYFPRVLAAKFEHPLLPRARQKYDDSPNLVRKQMPRRDSHTHQGHRKACLTQIPSSIECTMSPPAINPTTALSTSTRNTPVRDLDLKILPRT